jgi:DNA-binding transcriptional regulator YdaS (Cro superfamily)
MAKQPHDLLDRLSVHFALKADGALARRLGISPAVISKIRNRRAIVSSGTMLYVLEATGWTVAELRGFMDADSTSWRQICGMS